MLQDAKQDADYGSRFSNVNAQVRKIESAIEKYESGLKDHKKLVEIFEVPGTSGSDVSSVSDLRKRARTNLRDLRRKLAPLVTKRDKLKASWDAARDKTGEEH